MTRSPLRIPNFRVVDIPPQAGKTILITGANNGLGLRAATALAGAGARIILACRNQATGAEALAQVCRAGPEADHRLVALDLADLGSVREAAANAAALAPTIDVLINNAGLMAIPFATTADGFEMQLGTNHLGHFAFTDGVLTALLAAPAPRVVTLASIAHRQGRIVIEDLNFRQRRYRRMVAYQQSKLANLLFGAELARRSETAGLLLKSVVAHPGVAATNLFDSMVPSIPGALEATHLGLRMLGNSESQGALSQLYAATMPDVRNGDYLGPNKLFGVRGPVERSPRARAARDTMMAKRLWEKSIELTGARFDALQTPPNVPSKPTQRR
ncbi:oxidoreductase [Mycolicibacterium komossense]|uniref:SDR family NAD(P)-dependent oxidoreductase n=1 Tax=Mycolicibacterium komossense TaxID=1779 RepID=A0ABT3CFY5_9MYCO|nr:oxidoreductase [Mycolicibacterium komossense]MCV7228380.1 SDR family NAD(P)-dependent oxidoreductase [Mycolicibacterium komossense]